jgi:hypothetical protein
LITITVIDPRELQCKESEAYELWLNILYQAIVHKEKFAKRIIDVPLRGGVHRCNKFLVVEEGG